MPTLASLGAVWRLAAPMILSNVSIACLGLVDTAVLAHLDAAYYLGAVALATVIFNFVYWGLGFLRMGTTGLVAQQGGAGSSPDTAILQGLALALLLGFALLLLQMPIAALSFPLLGGSAPVQEYAAVYFHTKIWGAPASLSVMVVVGALIGLHRTGTTLRLVLLINCINMILDLIFVLGFGWHVRGVAWASVIAEYTGLAYGLWILGVSFRRPLLVEALGDVRALGTMLTLNRDIFLRTLCLIFTFAFFTREGARQGDVILAANAVLLNFQSLMALGLDGFANALEALVGKAVGARERGALMDAVYAGTLFSALLAVGFSLAYLLGGGLLIDGLTDLPEIRAAARAFLPWLIASPLLSVWCFALDGIFIGATRGREMRNSMLQATVLVFLPAWYLLRPWGNHGLWAALMVFMVYRGISLAFIFRRLDRRGAFE